MGLFRISNLGFRVSALRAEWGMGGKIPQCFRIREDPETRKLVPRQRRHNVLAAQDEQSPSLRVAAHVNDFSRGQMA